MFKLILTIIVIACMELKYYSHNTPWFILLDTIILIGFKIYDVNIKRSEKNELPIFFKRDKSTLTFYIILILLVVCRMSLFLYTLQQLHH